MRSTVTLSSTLGYGLLAHRIWLWSHCRCVSKGASVASEAKKFVFNILMCILLGESMCSFLSSSFRQDGQSSEPMRSVISTIQSKLNCDLESLPSFFNHAKESCKDNGFLGDFYVFFCELASLLPAECLPEWLPAFVNGFCYH